MTAYQKAAYWLLGGFLTASLSLNLLQTETAANLLRINKSLVDENRNLHLRPHPVHDCSITAWPRGDGSILLIVNGEYEHILVDACRASF